MMNQTGMINNTPNLMDTAPQTFGQSPADQLLARNNYGIAFGNQMNGTNVPPIQAGKNPNVGGQGQVLSNFSGTGVMQPMMANLPGTQSSQDANWMNTGREDQVGTGVRQAMSGMYAPSASWMASPGSERGSSKNAQTQGGQNFPFPQPQAKPEAGQNNPITGPGASSNNSQSNGQNVQNWNSPLSFGGWTAGQSNGFSGNGMPGPMGNGWNNLALQPNVQNPGNLLGMGNVGNIPQNAGMHMQNYGGGKNPAGMLVDTLGRMGSSTVGSALGGPIGGIGAAQAYRHFVPQLGYRPGIWQNDPNMNIQPLPRGGP